MVFEKLISNILLYRKNIKKKQKFTDQKSTTLGDRKRRTNEILAFLQLLEFKSSGILLIFSTRRFV